ncbi:MAG: DNA adenine methylase [Pirellulales bacterium]
MQKIAHEVLLSRAGRWASAEPRPFLRWAGSKRALLAHIVPLLPRGFATYREPFLGSGALFFLLQPTRAVLSDACSELVQTFSAVRDNVSAVAGHLRPLAPDPDTFRRFRARRSRGRLRRAAEFIYLNKTCWNGLYRVNLNGEFNVPYGRPKSDGIVDFSNLRACAAALGKKGIKLWNCDFAPALERTQKGDLVYLDPPYVTRHNNNGFVEYNEVLFSWADQKRLAELARQLADSGASVIITNADHHEIVELYSGFTIVRFNRKSTIASSAGARGKVSEMIAYRIAPPVPMRRNS